MINEQVGGDHYKKYTYQPMQFAEDIGLSPMIFSALKYICRHRDKGKPREDLDKALHCVHMFCETGKIKDLNFHENQEILDKFLLQFQDFNVGFAVSAVLRLQQDHQFHKLAVHEITRLQKKSSVSYHDNQDLSTIQLEYVSGKITHALTITVVPSVIKNKGRLKTYCDSLLHRVYGDMVILKHIRDKYNNILWSCNDK